MIIDVEKIEHAILYEKTAQQTANRFGLSIAVVNQYRANPEAKAFRDWQKMSLETAINIMSVIHEEEEETAKKEKFEEDVEKYGKSVTFDEAISDIFANLPERLEIGDTQNYLLSDANKFHSSASFEFEVVGFDEDELPVFEYTGFNSIV